MHFSKDILNKSSVSLSVRVMPLVNILWAGCLFNILGIAALIWPGLLVKKSLILNRTVQKTAVLSDTNAPEQKSSDDDDHP